MLGRRNEERLNAFSLFFATEVAALDNLLFLQIKVTEKHDICFTCLQQPLEVKTFSPRSMNFYPSSGDYLQIRFRMDPVTGEVLSLGTPLATAIFKARYKSLYACLETAAHEAMEIRDHPRLVHEKLKHQAQLQKNSLQEYVYQQVERVARHLIQTQYSHLQVKIDKEKHRIFVSFPQPKGSFVCEMAVDPEKGWSRLLVSSVRESHAFSENEYQRTFMAALQKAVEKAHQEYHEKTGFIVEVKTEAKEASKGFAFI